MGYEELLKDRLEEYHYEENAITVSTAFLDMFAKDYATMKCKELLEIVAEKAIIKKEIKRKLDDLEKEGIYNLSIDKNSILNAVDLDEFIV